MPRRAICCLSIGATILACTTLAQAGSSHLQFRNVHGHEFSVIGNPGNAAYVYHPSPNPSVPPINIGRVDYAYAITTTEVTGSQWFRFVQAYAPFVDKDFAASSTFTSGIAIFNGFNGQGVPQYQYNAAVENIGGTMSWRFAARYVNWLHNGAPLAGHAAASDFEQGAYDTSTFGGGGSQGPLTDQARRSEGARFWIPSWDEWTKAVYYDPDRHGEGQDGYWQYPDGGDDPLISGHPEQGGETNAGTNCDGCPRTAGVYEDVRSPWGLWDASGSQREWLEDYNPLMTVRLRAGSGYGQGLHASVDRLGETFVSFPDTGHGFRIAMMIPGPSSCGILLAVFPFAARRRR